MDLYSNEFLTVFFVEIEHNWKFTINSHSILSKNITVDLHFNDDADHVVAQCGDF